MIIKKLSKEQLEEGLTLELVNKIQTDRNYSPVQLSKDSEPVILMAFSKGFWIMENGSPKKENGKNIEVSVKDCKIGRLRYLLRYGKEEKAAKVKAIVDGWANDVRKKLDEIQTKVLSMKNAVGSDELPEGLELSIIRSMAGDEAAEKFIEEKKQAYNKLAPWYEELEKLWDDRNIYDLLQRLDIKQFTPLMFSANNDDEDAMRIVKAAFGAEAIDNWDGDILNRYAAIEVEKQYVA